MKVLVVVFAAIYLVSAVPTAKKIIFNEDDSISLIDQTMRQITIAKPMGLMEGRFLDVVVNCPTIPRKSIVLDVEAKVYGPAQEQMRLLYTILMPFRNEYVTEEMYGDILRQVKMVVDEGRLSPIVCATLKALTHDELFQKLIVGEGIFAREARIMGVPVTGDIINKIHETKMYPTTGLWYPTTKYTTPYDMKYFGGYKKSMGLYTPEFLRTNVPEYMRTNVPEFMRTNVPEHMRINVPEYMRTNVLGHMRINTPEYMGVYAPQHMGLYKNAGLYNALYNTEPMGVWNMLNLGRQYERSTPSMMSMMNKMMMMHEYPQMTYRQDYYGTTPYLGLRQIMGQIYDRPMTVGNQYPLFFGKTTQVY